MKILSELHENSTRDASLVGRKSSAGSSIKFYHSSFLDKEVSVKFWKSFGSGLWIRADSPSALSQ